MFLSDVLVKQFIPNGYGPVDVAPYSEHAAILDRRARIAELSDETSTAGLAATAAENILDEVVPYFTGRFGQGVDGVIAYLASVDLQTFLPNAVIPIHVDHVWKLGMSGSVEVPMAAFTCGGQRVVIDYDPLVQALLVAFNGTEGMLTALDGKDPRQLLEAANIALEESAEVARGTGTWFATKVAELEKVTDECQLPTTGEQLVTESFTLANIFNWRLTRVTGTVPAPEWEQTDEVARDGEMDTDGPVHAASALGFTLDRRPFFFEHDREDGPAVSGKPTLGSWYRLYDNPVTEQYNHGMQYQNDVGQWIAGRLLIGDVGPLPRRVGDSFWPE